MRARQGGESSASLVFPESEARERESVRFGNLVTVLRTKCKEPANDPIKIQLCNM